MAHEGKSALMDTLELRGVTRRDFLAYCGALAAMMGLSETMAPTIAAAIESSGGKLLPTLWTNQGACTGCTESTAQATNPDVASIVLDYLSINYFETIMMAQGESALDAARQTVEEFKGKYILVVEGSVMQGFDGNALLIGGRTGIEELRELGENALVALAVGSCAVDGGWVRAFPNPADATGTKMFFDKEGITTPVINLPTCPVNPEWIVAIVVDALLLGLLNDDGSVNGDAVATLVNKYAQPVGMFGQTIHDNCERRGHFENGEFVYEFGSAEEAKGYCLYPVGCKGPQTYTNCPIVQWNNRTSWCVQSGSPCIGCGDWNWVDQNTPFLKRFRDIARTDGDPSGMQPALPAVAVAGVAAVGLIAHGLGMKAAGRTSGGGPEEDMKEYDRKKGGGK